MSRKSMMRILVTRAGVPNKAFFSINALSVFLNVTMEECCYRIHYGFYLDGTNYVLIDQQMYNYASGIWIMQNPANIRRRISNKRKYKKWSH